MRYQIVRSKFAVNLFIGFNENFWISANILINFKRKSLYLIRNDKFPIRIFIGTIGTCSAGATFQLKIENRYKRSF